MQGETITPARAPTVESSLRRAQDCLAQGDLESAERLCRDVVQLAPQHAGAYLLLGVVMLQKGAPREALRLFEASIEIDGSNAAAHANLGLAQRALGRVEAALESFDRALSHAPDFLGVLIERGNALLDLGQPEAALASFEHALRLDSSHAFALNGCGNALLELGEAARALGCFDRALPQLPQAAWLHANRATALASLGKAAEALVASDAAIANEADNVAAHHARGDALQDLRRFDESVAAYDRALALDPARPRTWCNRARALVCLNRWVEAVAGYDRTLELADTPAVSGVRINRPEVCVNRGSALHFLCRLDAAQDSFRSALRVQPEHPEAHANLAQSLLLSGDLANGWREYEWRWSARKGEARRHTSHPLWLGEPSLAGKTILLHAEQGLGDTLQFCRYATILAAGGARVILEVQESLHALLKTVAGVAEVIPRGAPLPPFDYQCPLLSLPLACGTTLANIPGQPPYLRADAEKARYWRARIGQSEKLRVGLVWSGGFIQNRPDHWAVSVRRNVPLRSLRSLREPGIEFYSLQKGQPAESEWAQLRSQHWDGPGLIDWTAELRDFADTAALVENLDLVIAVDTSTAHLAGALGKPVWILNRFDTCWRWLLDRADSPWYPTARLYRQSTPGTWDDAIERLRGDLLRLGRK